MLTIAILLFAVAAVFGIINLSRVAKQTSPPAAVVYSHGTAAALGLIMLIIYAVQHPGEHPKWSLILFAVAAAGGFLLYYNDRVKGKPGPVALAVIHGLVAVTAFVILLMFFLG
ncbi:MAG: hypothetical protein AAB316_24595 [Bacteroidota bacterium]